MKECERRKFCSFDSVEIESAVREDKGNKQTTIKSIKLLLLHKNVVGLITETHVYTQISTINMRFFFRNDSTHSAM